MDISSGDISGMVFKRVIRDDLGEFSFDGPMLSVLVELDGKKTVADMARSTGLSIGVLRQVIQKFLQLKIIDSVAAAVPKLDRGFFDYLTSELSLAIGPIAGVVIEDAVADLGHDINDFPSNQAAELVDFISQEIQKEERRTTFKKNMVNKLREMRY